MFSLIQRSALMISGFVLTTLAAPATFAATTSGIDTPLGVQTLPLAVEGNAVITLTDTPNTATVTGTLNVSGPIQVGNTNQACTAQNAGAMRFNATTSNFEGCNGKMWMTFGSFDDRVWIDKIGARQLNVLYVNDTGRPIEVSVRTLSTSPVTGAGPGYVFRCNATLFVNSIPVSANFVNSFDSPAPTSGGVECDAIALVPAGGTYEAIDGAYPDISLAGWTEFR
jgi:hypothetical protein